MATQTFSRPPRGPVMDRVVAVRFTAAELDRLDGMAQAHECSRGELVRAALDKLAAEVKRQDDERVAAEERERNAGADGLEDHHCRGCAGCM